MTYRHTPEMGEISGFGGGYENTCQNMLEAGVIWLQAHPKTDLIAKTSPQIYGFFSAESDDAKALEKAIMAAEGADDCTGAMHHAVMSRLFYIAGQGWDAYVAKCSKQEEAEKAEGGEAPNDA